MSGSQQQEQTFQPISFEGFSGLNTQAERPAIEDTEMAVCDGFMPIGKSTLRTLPDIPSTPIFTGPSGKTIAFFDFGNILDQAYMVAVISDGSIYLLNLVTSVLKFIAPAGTIQSPSRTTCGITQWGSTYIILVSNQTNGYFVIDGNLLYLPGGLGPGVEITNGGSGYTAPTAALSGGSGSGATFSVTQVGGVITDVQILTPGTGYLPTDTVTMVFGGGGTGATAAISFMPTGVMGTAAEVYQSRVWVVSFDTCIFSGPESFLDFSTAVGGGAFTSNDSFLRVAYIQPRQTNGYLYFIADSSVNYIGGVQTSGSPPETSFTNQNADPEIGTPYAATVQVVGSNIIFANAFGIHVSYGGRVTKVSDMLDGIYSSAPIGSFLPSASKAIIYGKRVLMLLWPVIDPISGANVNKLLMWDSKRWFTAQQSLSLTYVACLEINSVITAYGTDGQYVYQLFAQPQTNLTKTVRSKLFSQPGGFLYQKSANRVWLLAAYNSSASPNITFAIDNETNNSASITFAPSGSGLTSGFYVSPPTANGQTGALLGITLSTNAADVTILSAAIDAVPTAYRG